MAREGVRRGGVYNPDSYCPICGQKWFNAHRCPETILRAIDGAHHRDEDEVLAIVLDRPVGERLHEGLKILSQDVGSDE